MMGLSEAVLTRILIGGLILSGVLQVLAVVVAIASGFAGKRLSDLSEEKLVAAKDHIARVEKDTATAQRDAAVAQREAAHARTELERERTARLELQQQVAWRQLTDAQAKAMKAALVGKHFPVTIGWRMYDPEAEAYAAQIREVFENAGYPVERVPIMMDHKSWRVWTEQSKTPEAERVRAALRAGGVDFVEELGVRDAPPVQISVAGKLPLGAKYHRPGP